MLEQQEPQENAEMSRREGHGDTSAGPDRHRSKQLVEWTLELEDLNVSAESRLNLGRQSAECFRMYAMFSRLWVAYGDRRFLKQV